MSDGHKLFIEREFNATPEELFRAWTDPNILCQWMGPGPIQCKDAKVDLSVGGAYRIHMVSEEGDHIATGEYLEIEANKKLVFTWGWEGGDVKNTVVTVNLEASGNKTKLGLLHENLPTAESAEKHTQGWSGCLDKLVKVSS